jgi:hypothetical protein
MSNYLKDITGTPRERSLYLALVRLYGACETIHLNKPENWKHLGRAMYIVMQAIDSAVKNTEPETEQHD